MEAEGIDFLEVGTSAGAEAGSIGPGDGLSDLEEAKWEEEHSAVGLHSHLLREAEDSKTL